MNKFEILHIDQLELDKKNPRLPDTVAREEKEIIKYLARKTNIENLMLSIGVNDFFPGEAIVVTSTENDKYIVLEGNRRLAALRLLQDSTLAGNISGIAKASEEAKYTPTEIPVHVVSSRDDALQYLGFRHISGVQRWDPMAKARYLKLLFDKTCGEPEKRYAIVAREIGSRRDAVRRNLDALAVYEVIKNYNFFGVENLDEENVQFGVFYTAIGNFEIASFIGIRVGNKLTHPIVNPSSLKEESLRELTEWMFKKDSWGSSRLGESRNIAKLGEVIAHPKALAEFRKGVSLDIAFDSTVDNQQEFLRDISIATDHLKKANSNLDSVSSDDGQAVEMVQRAMKALYIAVEHLKIDMK